MTVYFAGTEVGDLLGGTGITTSPTSDEVDLTYSRCAVDVSNIQPAVAISQSEFGGASADGWWLRARYFTPNQLPTYFDYYMLRVADAVGNLAVEIDFNDGVPTVYLYKQGSATPVSTAISAYTLPTATPVFVTLHCYTSGGEAVLETYFNDVLESTLSFGSASDNVPIYIAKFFSVYTQPASVSEVVMADTSCLGWRVKTLPFTGDGAHTDWSAGYTGIDAYTLDDSGTTSSATGDLVTFTNSGLGGLQGSGIAAVAFSVVASSNGTNDLQLVLRKASTDYLTADKGASTGLVRLANVYNTDPSTGVGWSSSESLSTVEFGIKSVA